MINKQG